MKFKFSLSLKVNRLVRNFILSDLLLWGGWGLISPIFAIFIIDKIEGGTLVSVGIASAIYLGVKSVLQLPIADYLDKTDGEKDDFYALLLALVLASLTAFGFIFVNKLWQLYLIQFFLAISFALYTPAWTGIFTRHMDKERSAFEWSLDSGALGLSAGLTGFLGGVVANYFGFTVLFISVGILTLLSAVFIFLAPELVFPPKAKTPAVLPEHTPPHVP